MASAASLPSPWGSATSPLRAKRGEGISICAWVVRLGGTSNNSCGLWNATTEWTVIRLHPRHPSVNGRVAKACHEGLSATMKVVESDIAGQSISPGTSLIIHLSRSTGVISKAAAILSSGQIYLRGIKGSTRSRIHRVSVQARRSSDRNLRVLYLFHRFCPARRLHITIPLRRPIYVVDRGSMQAVLGGK